MSSNLEKLISVSSSSIDQNEPQFSQHLCELAGLLTDELTEMLHKRNGFYALESALHVFPALSHNDHIGLEHWNSDTLWRADYRGLADNCLFFAEDIFGGQFCIRDDKVFSFEPETGLLEYLADCIEDWAGQIISNYDILTGYRLAHEWQATHGQITANKRLLPKKMFVLGGEFIIENLYLSDSIEGMKLRADVANQIRDLPDGAQIEVKIKS